MWAAHLFVVTSTARAAPSGPVLETDRLAFLGRNRTTRPRARLDRAEAASDDRRRARPHLLAAPARRVPPDGEAPACITGPWSRHPRRGARPHRPASWARRPTNGSPCSAWTQSQVRLRHLGISAKEASQFQSLGGLVTFSEPSLRARRIDTGPRPPARSPRCGRSVSRATCRSCSCGSTTPTTCASSAQVVQAFEYWRLKRLAVDLVVLNERSLVRRELHEGLHASGGSMPVATHVDGPTGARSTSSGPTRLTRGEPAAALVAARRDPCPPRRHRRRSCVAHRRRASTRSPSQRVSPRGDADARRADGAEDLLYFNGLGGFDVGRAASTSQCSTGTDSTPAPWTNVVANEQFGFHATAEGAGYTWWRNSRDNQLTPWRNDPVSARSRRRSTCVTTRRGALARPPRRRFARGPAHRPPRLRATPPSSTPGPRTRPRLVQFVPRTIRSRSLGSG